MRIAMLVLGLYLCGCAAHETVVVDPANAAVEARRALVNDYVLVVHGGAGVISKDKSKAEIALYESGLQDALRVGEAILKQGGSALDAVTATVETLEENPLFNAGRGAVYTNAGTHELDAAIMDGSQLACGAVSGIQHIRNPVQLARRVMEQTRHVFLVGAGAEEFGRQQGLTWVDNSFFSTDSRYQQWQKRVAEEEQKAQASEKGGSTVGAVARDRNGNVAAATSTGGLTNKRFGRVGDVPVIGAGTYADNNSCAVSCTGTGEEFIRHTVARSVAALMQYKGLSLGAAARSVVHETLAPDDGGLIAVDAAGNWVWEFNSPGMFRAVVGSSGVREVRIWE